MSKVSLHALPSFCNNLGSLLTFTFRFIQGQENGLYTPLILAANKICRRNTAHGEGAFKSRPKNRLHAINVTATCKCLPPFAAALKNDLSLVCMFHDSCPEVADDPQAFWFHPVSSPPIVSFPL